MDRREFLETSALLTGGALLTRAAGASAADELRPTQIRPVPKIGLQAGAVSFVDEGTEKVLDN